VTTTSDFLVLGSGIAALRAALALADRGRVCILTKGEPEQGSTGWAQGGIAAAMGEDDSPDLHYEDTLAAGDGLCEPAAVRMLVEEGPAYVSELLDWGARFDRQPDGRIAPTREAAHSVRRVLHAEDATGREISRVLHEQVAAVPAISVIDHAVVVELLHAEGRCVGAAYLDAQQQRHVAHASATLLATGGAGQVFAQTTNPAVIAGDGMAMAFEAGAEVADLEFVQFHPTVLDVAGRPRFLLSEALRGEGARLVNAAGEAFMSRYEEAAELAPRDRVARAIVRERERTGAQVYLSMAHLSDLDVHARFPQISEACRDAGLDLAREPIPVSPAVHYVMGGVVTDLDGRTSLPGLYAAGEVACTGVHGANRLASNSLLEGLVFGARAGAVMSGPARQRDGWAPGRLSACDPVVPAGGGAWPTGLDATTLRARTWKDLGLVRTGDGLREAEAFFSRAYAAARGPAGGQVAPALRSLVTVAFLMSRAALRREESRGGHYRTDFPERRDDVWSRHCSDVLQLQRRAD
jgi:L-aspartate oxidase